MSDSYITRWIVADMEGKEKIVDEMSYRIAELEAELAQIKANKEQDADSYALFKQRYTAMEAELAKLKWPRCTECNFELVDLGEGHGYVCEYCSLKEELAKYKLNWQTGKPPKDGDYFVKGIEGLATYLESDGMMAQESWSIKASKCQWAGPIEPPEE